MEASAAAVEEINVGVLLANSPATPGETLEGFAERLVQDIQGEIMQATGRPWLFHPTEPVQLSNDDARGPADYLDEASLRMVEGPFDLVLVITDVPLVSRKQRMTAGLASPIGRVAVISTRKLLIAPRGRPVRTLDSPSVRANAATLALHLLGHILDLPHAREGVMAPFRFREEREEVEGFSPGTRARLRARAEGLPERTFDARGLLSSLGIHLRSGARHLGAILKTLWKNRAILLPLSLPSLATAAVAPTFILVFTAEIWDVGLNMPPYVAWTFAIGSLLAATWYLVGVHNLFFPHKEKRVLTEHLAVINVTILLSVLLALVGLFLMVSLLMLFIETYIFPPQLISEWPTLEDPVVTLADKFLLAGFISSVGVLTGALAGGLESRTVIRHLALFEDEA